MLNFITFMVNIIVISIIGLIISDVVTFIYKTYKYYQEIEVGNLYTYFFWPNKKITIIIIEKSKGNVLYQYIFPDGSKGAMDSQFILHFYLSSQPLKK